MRTAIGGALAAVATLALVSCSSPTPTPEVAEVDPTIPTKAAPEPTIKAPAPPVKPSSKCIEVSTALGHSLMSGAETGTEAKFLKASAVKAQGSDSVYFVALKFSAAGVANQVGVFAATALTNGGGMVLAIDGPAKQFTTWPDADKTDVAISETDPSVSVAKACLK